MPPPKGQSYYDVLTAAINDISEHGYDSSERVAYWMLELKKAAARTMASAAQMDAMLKGALLKVYNRMVERGQIAQFHRGVGRFTVDRLRPQLRAELDRRILAAANLIVLNKEQAVARTMQRFSGWATSVPKGGSKAVDKAEEKDNIRKPLARLKFEERRVAIDQGQKLAASINEIVAKDGGAIALIWHSHWRQRGYNYREDHKERDGEVYLLRESWATRQGLVKAAQAGYYDKVTSVGEEPFCRCYAEFIYNLSDLPKEMLTRKGEDALKEARAKLRATTL